MRQEATLEEVPQVRRQLVKHWWSRRQRQGEGHLHRGIRYAHPPWALGGGQLDDGAAQAPDVRRRFPHATFGDNDLGRRPTEVASTLQRAAREPPIGQFHIRALPDVQDIRRLQVAMNDRRALRVQILESTQDRTRRIAEHSTLNRAEGLHKIREGAMWDEFQLEEGALEQGEKVMNPHQILMTQTPPTLDLFDDRVVHLPAARLCC
mmetsp:Transcript_226/g.670  ORF Transcript_226/g.670 Transcript_226/m.670 type:complete len:207 (+) Transcript_226:554-1174(+)